MLRLTVELLIRSVLKGNDSEFHPWIDQEIVGIDLPIICMALHSMGPNNARNQASWCPIFGAGGIQFQLVLWTTPFGTIFPFLIFHRLCLFYIYSKCNIK